MTEFNKTVLGKKFYETDVPKLINVLEKIAKGLEQSNILAERKYKLEEKLLKHQLKEINEQLKENENRANR